MDIIEFKKILEKYRKQECTRNEIKKFWECISDKRYEQIVKDTLSEGLSNFQSSEEPLAKENFNDLLNRIESRILFKEEKKNLWLQKGTAYFMRIAAIFIITFSLGALFSYLLVKPSDNPKLTYCEIKTPLGAKSEVTLPDGTIVWLNAGSKISYQNIFNNNNRNVILEGEAYFKVAKNKELPFVVKTDGVSIVATGTEFNVKAYNDEGTIETTLVEGSVEIFNNNKLSDKEAPVCLLPKQKAIFIKEKQKQITQEVETEIEPDPEPMKLQEAQVLIDKDIDPVPIISWKDNKLIIKGEEMGILAVMLERKYNISFVFRSENIKHFRFSGTLEDETLTQVLDVIKLTAPIDYKLEGKTVEIYENSQMIKKFRNHLTKKYSN